MEISVNALVKCGILVPLIGLMTLPVHAELDQSLADELQKLSDGLQATLPKGTLLLATCGPAEGRAYYLNPKPKGWADDPISKGRTIFIAGPDGAPNILYRDASGSYTDATKDGAKISYSFIDDCSPSAPMAQI